MNPRENTVDIGNGLFLSCLCGEHPETSTCEVYLRNTGRWTPEMEQQRNKGFEQDFEKFKDNQHDQ